MEIAYTVSLIALLILIIILLLSLKNDRNKIINANKTNNDDSNSNLPPDLDKEKKKAEIQFIYSKSKLCNNAADLIALLNALLVVGILIAGVMFIGSIGACTSIF